MAEESTVITYIEGKPDDNDAPSSWLSLLEVDDTCRSLQEGRTVAPVDRVLSGRPEAHRTRQLVECGLSPDRGWMRSFGRSDSFWLVASNSHAGECKAYRAYWASMMTIDVTHDEDELITLPDEMTDSNMFDFSLRQRQLYRRKNKKRVIVQLHQPLSSLIERALADGSAELPAIVGVRHRVAFSLADDDVNLFYEGGVPVKFGLPEGSLTVRGGFQAELYLEKEGGASQSSAEVNKELAALSAQITTFEPKTGTITRSAMEVAEGRERETYILESSDAEIDVEDDESEASGG